MLINLISVDRPNPRVLQHAETLLYVSPIDVFSHFSFVTLPKLFSSHEANKRIITIQKRSIFEDILKKVKSLVLYFNQSINVRYTLFYDHYGLTPYDLTLEYMKPHEANLFPNFSFITHIKDSFSIKYLITKNMSGTGYLLQYGNVATNINKSIIVIRNEDMKEWINPLLCETKILEDSLNRIKSQDQEENP